MNKFMRYVIFLLLVMSFLGTLSYAQVSRTLTGGRMVYTSNEAITDDDIQWPVGVRNFSTDMLASFGIDIAVKMTWTDLGGVNHDVKVAEVANNRFSDIANVIVPVKDAFKRVFKYKHPARWIDGKNWQDVSSVTDPVDTNLPSDAMLYHKCTTWVGIDIERWTYNFMTDANQDYIFLEWVFTNTSTETKNEVYFGLRAEPGTGSHYPGTLWGNYVGAAYKSGKDPVRLYYNYDADRTGDGVRDDRGEPGGLYGNFTRPQFMSYALIHADKGPADESNDINAPFKGGWSQRQLSPDLNSNTVEEVYAFFGSPWDPINPDRILWPGSNDMIRANHTNEVLWRTPETRAFIDSWTEQEKCALFSFGPFTMAPGEDIRFVMAFVGGTIDSRLAIDAGFAYNCNYEGLRPRRPFPAKYDFSSIGIPQGTQSLTLEQKDILLDTGIDSLIKNAVQAQNLWQTSVVRKGTGTFNTELAPPSPSLTLISQPGFIQIEWGTEAETQYNDVKGYKIYRNYIRPPALEVPTDTLFTLIKDIPGTGVHSYKDEDVIRGRAYYYYVTAYNSKGVESSRYLNRGETGVIEQKVSPTRAPEANWKEKVVVVPNPYHSRGSFKLEGAKLAFLNLPAMCNIHIYTMTGDKVQTLVHTSGTGDQTWDRQDTFSTMEIVSGIYLYVVEELDDKMNATGEQAIGKFIVVK
ncbi:hypothetical protein JW964_01405 [candidate division KSB1 bacterium]|nr:hypothetical protein [candidate division KSB1 bacterium]